MNGMSQITENLFDQLVQLPSPQREAALAVAPCSEQSKERVRKLLRAADSESPWLNENVLNDLGKQLGESFWRTEDSETPLAAGSQVDQYSIVSLLGAGGMSFVYAAEQKKPIERKVALKFIRRGLLAPESLARFFREQQLLSLIDHPNIAKLYHVNFDDLQQPYAAIEWVDGQQITTYCTQRLLSLRQRLEIFLTVCDGLQHVHERGIVHRDIKPDNLLVSESSGVAAAKIIDFGISRFSSVAGDSGGRNDSTGVLPQRDSDCVRPPTAANLSEDLTQLGQRLGAPRYMSPEQFRTMNVDAKSDQYSAALVLWELIVGESYRVGDSSEALVEAMLEGNDRHIIDSLQDVGASEPLAELKTLGGSHLDWILCRALSRNPADRYPSIAKFADDLRAVLAGETPSVAAPPMRQRLASYAKRNPRLVFLTSVFVLLTSIRIVAALLPIPDTASSGMLERIERADAENDGANELVFQLAAAANRPLDANAFPRELIPSFYNHYFRIRAGGGPQTERERNIYAILAVLVAVGGDFQSSQIIFEEIPAELNGESLQSLRRNVWTFGKDSAQRALANLTKLAPSIAPSIASSIASEASRKQIRYELQLVDCYLGLGEGDAASKLLLKTEERIGELANNDYEACLAASLRAKVLLNQGKMAERTELLQRLLHQHDRFISLYGLPKERALYEQIQRWLDVKSQTSD